MMRQTRNVVTDRSQEIRRIRDLISKIERGTCSDDLFSRRSTKQKAVRSMYSAFVLMHYSLIEAVVTVAVTELLEAVGNSSEPVEECNEGFVDFLIRCRIKELQKLNFSKWGDVVKELINDLKSNNSKPLVTESQVRALWAGNLDAKKIREQILQRLNIDFNAGPRTRNGADLVRIKNERNDLAHGIRSWDQVGSDYSWQELKELSNRTLCYTIKLVRCFENGLEEKFWLSTDSTDVASA